MQFSLNYNVIIHTVIIWPIVIFIRFERLAYTFNEPEFEEENGEEVFLVKSGITELTYYVLLERRDSEESATFDVDYHSNIRVSGGLAEFPADKQRINVFGDEGFILTLYPDYIPEGPESFQIFSNPTGNPIYQRPATGGVTTLIIEDNDSMYGHFTSIMSIIKLALFFTYRHHNWLGENKTHCI